MRCWFSNLKNWYFPTIFNCFTLVFQISIFQQWCNLINVSSCNWVQLDNNFAVYHWIFVQACEKRCEGKVYIRCRSLVMSSKSSNRVFRFMRALSTNSTNMDSWLVLIILVSKTNLGIEDHALIYFLETMLVLKASFVGSLIRMSSINSLGKLPNTFEDEDKNEEEEEDATKSMSNI